MGHREAWPIIFEGLSRLEHRGYDSAGIGILTPSGKLEIRKSAGKVRELELLPSQDSPSGTVGIGHTRWATHGEASDTNAHPHTDCDHQIAVVHNGIVENYRELKQELLVRGHRFTSETDSEVIAHLLEEGLASGESFEASLLRLASQLQGANAIAAIRRDEPTKLLALRLGHAGGLVVAQRDGEAMFASDLPALVPFASEVCFLNNGEMAVIAREGTDIITSTGKSVVKHKMPVSSEASWVDKGGHDHFMLKEILEQPQALSSALRGRVDFDRGVVRLEELSLTNTQLAELQRVVLIGCGTSLNACMVGHYLIEELAGIPTTAESSSEFRYRKSRMDSHTLVIAVGQSGETADTLAAMQDVKDRGGRLATICNVEGSQATRLAEATLYMRSGLEVGVASTKTFIASLTILALMAVYLGQARGTLGADRRRQILQELARGPNLMGRIVAQQVSYKELAQRYARFDHFLYLGRGLMYPIAIEGALKLKEISYIHAEGHAAGEMKHGPIALVDDRMPVLAIAPRGLLYDKMVSNIKEVKARGGTVVAVATEGDEELAAQVDDVLYIPQCEEVLSPILAVLPLQLLAYHVAVRRGCDVDQPRNLAKSVTVE